MKKILTIHIWTTIPPSTANTAFFRRMATGRPTKKHLLEQAGKDAKQSKLDSFLRKPSEVEPQSMDVDAETRSPSGSFWYACTLTHALTYKHKCTHTHKRVWTRKIALPQHQGKKKDDVVEEKEYKRPYLINNVTGDVVSVQDKAWNDSVYTCLYVDVLLGPTKEKLGKLFLVWDSCGPHTVQAVKDVFAEWGIDVAQLPVRMTSLLQIMDLVVNGPVKAAVRDARCQQLVGHLRAFLAARKLEDDKPVAERVYAPFSPPPKPTQT